MVKSKPYQEYVQIAEKAVEHISDPKLKVNAFQAILQDLLGSRSNSKEDIAIDEPKKKDDAVDITNNNLGSKKRIAKFLNVSTDQVDLIYNVEKSGTYSLTCDFGHDMGKWSQIQYVLLSLFINHVLTNKTRAKSLKISKEMRGFGFSELPNINKYLRTLKPSLLHVYTKKKKSESEYEITSLGISRTKALCQEIIENNGIANSRPKSLQLQIRVGRPKSDLTRLINNLIMEGFFDMPKPISDLKKKLEEMNCFYTRGIIDEKIRRGFLGKLLNRTKKNKMWHYYKKR